MVIRLPANFILAICGCFGDYVLGIGYFVLSVGCLVLDEEDWSRKVQGLKYLFRDNFLSHQPTSLTVRELRNFGTI